MLAAQSSGLRVLHTADWQIGRQYTRFDTEDAAALFEARFAVVQSIARYASQNGVDLVLVAGDVFDAQTVSDRTVRRLFNAMDGFGGPWVMIPGNHDAALAESVWTRAKQLDVLPDNLHLALTPEPIVLDHKRLALLPAPLTQRHTHVDLTAWFDHVETPDEYFRIGLAHGSVTGILAESIDASNPIAADRAARARLDYLALGDWHGMRSIDARTWYSGTPETDRFRNNESAHILDVTLDAPGALPQVDPIQIGHYIWDERAMVLNVPSDVDGVLHYLQTLTERHVASLTLTGRVDLAGQARLQEAVGAAQARARALECNMNDLALHPTDDDIAGLQADGYVAEVLDILRAMQGQTSAPLGDTVAAVPPGSVDTVSTTPGQGAPDASRVARDALVLLASILQQDKS